MSKFINRNLLTFPQISSKYSPWRPITAAIVISMIYVLSGSQLQKCILKIWIRPSGRRQRRQIGKVFGFFILRNIWKSTKITSGLYGRLFPVPQGIKSPKSSPFWVFMIRHCSSVSDTRIHVVLCFNLRKSRFLFRKISG